MLKEASRVVRSGGTIAMIHWQSNIATPRGPSADIRADANAPTPPSQNTYRPPHFSAPNSKVDTTPVVYFEFKLLKFTL